MWSIFNPVRVRLNRHQDTLELSYKPASRTPIYDICDLEGHVLKTGVISEKRLKVRIPDLLNACYILLIMDGDNIESHRFIVSR